MTQLRIFLTGGWGYGNHGDNAILEGSLAAINEAFPQHSLSLTSFNEKELLDKHRLKSSVSLHKLLSFRKPLSYLRWPAVIFWRISGVMLSPSLNKQIREMKSSDLIIFGGGGYFNDSWKDAFPSRIVELEFAKASGRPYVILGQTLGPFSPRNVAGPLARVLRSCRMVAHRDLQSGEIAKAAGVPVERRCYTADLAHLIPLSPRKVRNSTQAKRVGVMLQTFRQYEARDGLVPLARIQGVEKYFAELCTTLDKIVTSKLDLEFVLISSTTWDLPFMERLAIWMKAKGLRFIEADLVGTPVGEFVSSCQSVDVMLSTNMHPVILATIARIPTVSLSYHFKLSDYMDRIGRGAYCHRIDDFDPNLVSNQVLDSLDLSESDRIEFQSSVETIINDARMNIDVLLEAVK